MVWLSRFFEIFKMFELLEVSNLNLLIFQNPNELKKTFYIVFNFSPKYWKDDHSFEFFQRKFHITRSDFPIY